MSKLLANGSCILSLNMNTRKIGLCEEILLCNPFQKRKGQYYSYADLV